MCVVDLVLMTSPVPDDFRAFDRAGTGFELLTLLLLLLVLPALLAMNSWPDAETEMASTATIRKRRHKSHPNIMMRCMVSHCSFVD